MSISGCHLHCSQPDINCVGFFGLRNAFGEPGYGVKVGGGLSSAPHFAQALPVWIAPEQVWPVTKAISETYRDEGYRAKRNRARFKFLVADWGVERILQEVQKRLGFTLLSHTDSSFPEDPESDHMGVHLQKSTGTDCLYWVGIAFPGGRLRSGQLETIGKIASRHAQSDFGEIRLTNKQNLILSHIPEGNLSDLKRDLSEAGFVYEPSNFRKGCVSCTGIEFCNLAVAETKNRMIALVSQLEATSGWYRNKIRIHFSGCPSSCGQHQIADIGLRGARTKVDGKVVDAYDLFVGGRLGNRRRFNELLKGKILASDVHTVIDALLRYYDIHQQDSETFSDFCERLPRTELLSGISSEVANS